MPNQIPVQDPTHVAAKMRNRVTKPSIFLPISRFVVSAKFLEILLHQFTRAKHLLTEKDLSPKDKMNFKSVLRFCNPRLQKLLRENNPASKATEEYLKVMFYVTNAYISKELGIIQEEGYKVSDNLKILNSYVCIEINAHALINITLKCMKGNNFTSFLPLIYGSQSNESFFRTLRSMSTTCFTIVNTSILEAMHKVRRIELQGNISVFNFEEQGERLFFPRTKQTYAHYEEFSKSSIVEKSHQSDAVFDDSVLLSLKNH